MTQLPLYPRRLGTTVLYEDGSIHAAGPFHPGAAEELRRMAARQRVASTREAMLRSAAHIEAWEQAMGGGR